MPKPNLWLERHRHRHDWALTAFDRFVRELAPELSAQLKGSEQVTVVVYGATQVGKTTLILDLLGLGSDTESEVVSVLRGEQARGKSATVMALRYGRSSDDYWYIGSSGPLEQTKATQTLAIARHRVEKGDVQNVVLTDILIPARLFPPKAKDSLDVDVRLIDLPGLDARNAHERELVAILARRYVTVADLVLLVTDASSLSFIRPERLELEELANWVHQPVRFRVVLTSCFSLTSVRNSLLTSPHDEAGLRALMIAEIQTLDLQIPPSFHDNVYVLELGDSASELAAGDPDYYSVFSPLVETTRRRLINDIKRSSGPFSRLYAAFQLDQVVTGQIASFHAKYEEHKTGLDAEFKGIESQIRKLYSLQEGSDVTAELLERKLELEAQCAMSKRWALALNSLLEADSSLLIESFFPAHSISQGGQSVSALQDTLSIEKNLLKDRYRSLAQAMESVLLGALGGDLQAPLQAFIQALSFDDFDDCDFLTMEYYLDHYSRDGYFFSSSFKNDVAMLLHGVEKSRQFHIKLAHGHFLNTLRLQVQSQTTVLPTIKGQLRQIEAKIEKCEAYKARLLALDSELERSVARMRESQEIAQHFERHIEEEFIATLQASTAEIVTSQTPTEKFLALMNSHLIISEAEKLYSGKSST